jgi:copper oxidase (laccase) domain-containing protein
MTIEEKLDRLTERHEALTQTVELIAGMQRANEEAHQRNEALLTRVIGVVEDLARMVQSHERRISGLEEGRA